MEKINTSTRAFADGLLARLVAVVGTAAISTACGGNGGAASDGGPAGSASADARRAPSGQAKAVASVPPVKSGKVVCFAPHPTPTACPNLSIAPAELPPVDCRDTMTWYARTTDVPDAKGECCYTAGCHYITGRPFVVDREAVTARAELGDGWSTESLAPDVADLSPDERRALAEAWTRDALTEHASIASFGRVALELMALGAPADLVEASHRAALDEALHARLSFALASAYAGHAIGPGPFPFEGGLALSTDLAVVARRLVREGCVGETVAAVVAAAEAENATDPVVRSVLDRIAEDEARHAELAWRTLTWLVEEGGEKVRDAARAELDAADAMAPSPAGADSEARSRLAPGAIADVAGIALARVVRPCARAFDAGASAAVTSPA